MNFFQRCIEWRNCLLSSGGQDAFMENYFESQRDQIFRGVEVLIYVFDIESQDRKKDMQVSDRVSEMTNQLNREDGDDEA